MASILAAHEAAHSLVATLYGLQVTEVRASASDGYECHYATPTTTGQWIARLCAAVAGGEAERLCGLAGEWRSSADNRNVAASLRHLCPDAPEWLRQHAIDDAVRTARGLLIQHWPLLLRIAERLDRDGTLTGQQIESIVRAG